MKLLSKNPAPGEVFYIPAIGKNGDIGFVIGRYIELIQPNVGHLIEVFVDFYTSAPETPPLISPTRRLFRPIMCSLRFAEIPRWKVLFTDPSYEKSQSDYDKISIAFPFDLWRGGKKRPARPEELQGLEDSTCWRMPHIIFRVNAHLAEYLGPHDCYDEEKIPKELRIGVPSATARVIDAAVAIDTLFKRLVK